jgi:hypothetical protein
MVHAETWLELHVSAVVPFTATLSGAAEMDALGTFTVIVVWFVFAETPHVSE